MTDLDLPPVAHINDPDHVDGHNKLRAALIALNTGKAEQSALPAKADKTYVDTELVKKADATATTTALASKSDKTATDAAIALKADKTALAAYLTQANADALYRPLNDPMKPYPVKVTSPGWNLGTGSEVFAEYGVEGHLVHVAIRLLFGTGATFGTGELQVSLPDGYPPRAGDFGIVNGRTDAELYDKSDNRVYVGGAYIRPTESVVSIDYTSAAVGGLQLSPVNAHEPWDWTVGDSIQIPLLTYITSTGQK